MSKQHKIRWRESDQKELARIVRNFNAKVSRLEKKARVREDYLYSTEGKRVGVVLPEKVQVKQLKKLINTRQDLKRELNAMSRFLKRGSEEFISVPNNNLEITKWQHKEMNRMRGIVNRRADLQRKRLAEIQATSGGEVLGYSALEARQQIGMGRAADVELQHVDTYISNMTKTDVNKRYSAFRTKAQSTYYTERDYQLKENYLKGLRENYNPEAISDVLETIENMDIDEFLKIFYAEGGSVTFDVASPTGYQKRAKKQNPNLELQIADNTLYEPYLKGIWIKDYDFGE